MKKYIFKLTIISVFFLFSCGKKEKIAPDLKEVSGPVEVVDPFTISNSNPDFLAGQVVQFGATFQGDAYWKITIVGSNSGATKTISGTSSVINASNATWDGTADDLPSFRNEPVVITLSFPISNEITSSTPLNINLTVAQKKNLDAGHVLITDFSENPNKITNVFDGNFAGVAPTNWQSNWAPTARFNDAPLKNPDGNFYCVMGPQAAWQDNADFLGHKSPYIDHLFITANSLGYPGYFPLIASPTKIYFNIMVYNASLSNNNWLQITLFEDDPNLGSIAKSYNIVKPNWIGWKLVTLSYLDFIYGDGTVTVNNPQKISGLQLTLLSAASQDILDAGTNPVSATFDHLIFTHYKPYQP